MTLEIVINARLLGREKVVQCQKVKINQEILLYYVCIIGDRVPGKGGRHRGQYSQSAQYSGLHNCKYAVIVL